MNWLLLVILIIIGGYTVLGYRRGFIKTIFLIFSSVLALLIASIISPYLSKVLQSNETMYQYIYDSVDERVDMSNDSISGKINQVQMIESLDIPTVLKESMKENNNSEVYDILDITNFHDYIVTYITSMIFNGIAYLIAYILSIIILRIISGALDIISKLPLIHGINKVGGLGIGLIHGLLIVWIFFIVITVFSNTSFGEGCFEAINQSSILSIIYDNNILLHYIMNIAQSFFV